MAFRKVSDFKEITLLYQSNGPAVFQFYTDMPGGTLTARLGAGVTLPSTGNTRKTTTIPLDNIQGTEYYPILTPSNTTQLFLLGGTIWLRPIGVYLDGSLGEIWQTQPIAIGGLTVASEKVKLFSKIELELVASAVGTLSVLTDVAGYGMAQRFVLSVAASHLVSGVLARRTVTSRLPYNTQGHLIQCILQPGAGQTLLYRARVWGRELPGGQWQWYPLPVIETDVEFTEAQLPIPPTPEAWQSAQLAIPPTPEEWQPAQMAIPPTPEEWHGESLPVKPTPDVPEWADLEGDK